MCGIFGVATVSDDAQRLEAMTRAGLASLRHRGPDAMGIWRHDDPSHHLSLGSTRLRVLDVSEAADMPLVTADGRTALVFNGEIYNYRSLRRLLSRAGYEFRTTSDTECVLHLYEYVRGDFRKMLNQLEGMFALALWDGHRSRLLVARDRLGIKPLFYHANALHQSVGFASEPTALVRAGLVPGTIDQDGLRLYLAWGHVPASQSIIKGVRGLEPGDAATWSGGQLHVHSWWRPEFSPNLSRDTASTVAELRATLDAAVARQTVADRPVGVFLSSGVDSRVVTKLATQAKCLPAVTLTFPDAPRLDEGTNAKAFARELGIDHHLISVPSSTVVADVQSAVSALAQPTVDALNTWFVSRAAADLGWVVALSGLGGDELFSGYGLWRSVPRFLTLQRDLRRFLGAGTLKGAARTVSRYRLGTRAGRLLEADATVAGVYAAVREVFSGNDLDRLVGPCGGSPTPTPTYDRLGPIDEIAMRELRGYMSSRLLADTDAVSMAFSLEARVPLLDDAVVRFALTIPAALRKRMGKQLLWQAAEIAPSVGKQGFELPMGHWLNGPMRAYAREALLDDDLPLADVLNRKARRGLWSQFEKGRTHWSRPWSVVVVRRWAAHHRLNA